MDDVVTFRVAIKVKVLLTSVYCVLNKYLGCWLLTVGFIFRYITILFFHCAIYGSCRDCPFNCQVDFSRIPLAPPIEIWGLMVLPLLWYFTILFVLMIKCICYTCYYHKFECLLTLT